MTQDDRRYFNLAFLTGVEGGGIGFALFCTFIVYASNMYASYTICMQIFHMDCMIDITTGAPKSHKFGREFP